MPPGNGSPRWDRQQEEACRTARTGSPRSSTRSRRAPAGPTRSCSTWAADPARWRSGCSTGCPRATVVAHRRRPAAAGAGPGRALRRARAALRRPGPAHCPAGRPRLGLDRAADAAVSTTALHWLPEPELRAMYAELATVLRPGGLLLDGDHFARDERRLPGPGPAGPGAPSARETSGASPRGHPENWRRLVGRGRRGSRCWPAWPPRAAPPAGRRSPRLRVLDAASPRTSRRCGRPASPRSARSGSAATTACCAAS